MHVRRLSAAGEFDRLALAWNTLAAGSPFRRWEWLRPWWRHYAAGRELYLLAVEGNDGRLVGVAPFFLEHSAARGRVLALLGSGEVCTDYLGLLALPKCEEGVAAVVAAWLAEAADSHSGDAWDLLELAAIEPTDIASTLLVERLAEHRCAVHRAAGPNCWRIKLPANWDEYVQGLSRSHRRQVRRGERRLATPGYARLH